MGAFGGALAGFGQSQADIAKGQLFSKQQRQQQSNWERVQALAERQQRLSEQREAFEERIRGRGDVLGQWQGQDQKWYAWVRDPAGKVTVEQLPGTPMSDTEQRLADYDSLLKANIPKRDAMAMVFPNRTRTETDAEKLEEDIDLYNKYKSAGKNDEAAAVLAHAAPALFRSQGAADTTSDDIMDTLAESIKNGAKLPAVTPKNAKFVADLEKRAKAKGWSGTTLTPAEKEKIDNQQRGLAGLGYSLSQIASNLAPIDSLSYRYRLDKLDHPDTYPLTKQMILKTLTQPEQDLRDAIQQARDDITVLRGFFGNQRSSEPQYRRFAALLPGADVAGLHEARHKLLLLQSLVAVIKSRADVNPVTENMGSTIEDLRPYIEKQIGPSANPKGLELTLDDGSVWAIRQGGSVTMIKKGDSW